MLTFYLGGVVASFLILMTGLVYRPSWVAMLGCMILVPIWPLCPLTALFYSLVTKDTGEYPEGAGNQM
jgi:hypothetical protein